MQKFVKKNIEVQAVQYDGMPESLEELVTLGLEYRLGEDSSITIVTPRGDVTGEIGDYILMSVTGDFEICNQDKFQKLYSAEIEQSESVEDNSNSASDNETESEDIIQKSQSSVKETFLNYFQISLCLSNLLMLVILPFVMNSVVKRTIKTSVETIYQEEIKRESDLLLEKTKTEAELIIDQAKKDAVLEADEAFRKEMERLTNERVKK